MVIKGPQFGTDEGIASEIDAIQLGAKTFQHAASEWFGETTENGFFTNVPVPPSNFPVRESTPVWTTNSGTILQKPVPAGQVVNERERILGCDPRNSEPVLMADSWQALPYSRYFK